MIHYVSKIKIEWKIFIALLQRKILPSKSINNNSPVTHKHAYMHKMIIFHNSTHARKSRYTQRMKMSFCSAQLRWQFCTYALEEIDERNLDPNGNKFESLLWHLEPLQRTVDWMAMIIDYWNVNNHSCFQNKWENKKSIEILIVFGRCCTLWERNQNHHSCQSFE